MRSNLSWFAHCLAMLQDWRVIVVVVAVSGVFLVANFGTGFMQDPAPLRAPGPQGVFRDPPPNDMGQKHVDEEKARITDRQEGEDVVNDIKDARVVSSSTFSSTTHCPPAVPCPRCPEGGPETLEVDYRRRIAATLRDVQTLIARVAGTKAVVDADWALRLEALAAELDPRQSQTSNDTWDFSARIPGIETPQKPQGHVCPEVYYGRDFNPPFHQHGMEAEKCTGIPPFQNVLSIILPVRSWAKDRISRVVTSIRETYDVPVVLAGTQDNPVINGSRIIQTKQGKSGAEDINIAVQQVTTPFVLIGESLSLWSNQSSLERLVRVVEEVEHVAVCGGAARDLLGHWSHGCMQQRWADYQATYSSGYYYSKYECMYCDDVLAPFVTSTKLLTTLPLSADLSGPAMYRDWFLKLRNAGHLAMQCPDVMFFVSNHVNMTRQDWKTLAKRWSLQTINFNIEEHHFTCEEVEISCGDPLGRIRNGFLLPPCCRHQMEQYLTYITDYGEQKNLPHELQAGSALGAVKMGAYLPWDYDTDLVFECRDFKKWRDMTPLLEEKKCRLTVTQMNKYITIYCPNFFLELYCHRNNYTSSIYLPPEYRNTPTRIWYGGRWTRVDSNPGLHSRNKIGLNDLRHAAHWRVQKLSSLGKKKGGYDNPGSWGKCKTPEHHSCLNRYPGDGNLPFIAPFRHP